MLNSQATLPQLSKSLRKRGLVSIHTIKESLNLICIQTCFLQKLLLACRLHSTQLKTYFKPIWLSITKCQSKDLNRLALRFAMISLETILQWSTSISQWKYSIRRGSSLTQTKENQATTSLRSLLWILLRTLLSQCSCLRSNPSVRKCFSPKEILKAKII